MIYYRKAIIIRVTKPKLRSKDGTMLEDLVIKFFVNICLLA